MGAGHSHSHGGDTRASRMIMASAILGVFFVVELTTALVIGSLALLADATHMLTDLVALFMGLTAVLLARRGSKSPARTYGWHRAEVFTAVANAVLLLGGRRSSSTRRSNGWVATEDPGRADDRGGAAGCRQYRCGPSASVAGREQPCGQGRLHGGDGRRGQQRRCADRRHRDGDHGWPYADTVVAVLVALWVLPRAIALARAALRILSESSPNTSTSTNCVRRWRGSTA